MKKIIQERNRYKANDNILIRKVYTTEINEELGNIRFQYRCNLKSDYCDCKKRWYWKEETILKSHGYEY